MMHFNVLAEVKKWHQHEHVKATADCRVWKNILWTAYNLFSTQRPTSADGTHSPVQQHAVFQTSIWSKKTHYSSSKLCICFNKCVKFWCVQWKEKKKTYNFDLVGMFNQFDMLSKHDFLHPDILCEIACCGEQAERVQRFCIKANRPFILALLIGIIDEGVWSLHVLPVRSLTMSCRYCRRSDIPSGVARQ